MRRFGRRALAAAGIVAAGLIAVAGCEVSTRSSLPAHIRTVEVHVFENRTMNYSIEGRLTRRIIEAIHKEPSVRVVNKGGEAILRGEIMEVRRIPIRETTENRPATTQLVVTARVSFWDDVTSEFFLDDAVISSNEAGIAVGLYDEDRGDTYSAAEAAAIDALAREIVRRTLGIW